METIRTADEVRPAEPARGDGAQRLLAFAALLALFLYSGFCLQTFPVAAPAILLDWSVPARDLALPLALTAIGTGLGSVLGGFIGDARGRKLPILGFAALQAIALLLCGFATGPAGLNLLLFLVGLGLGGYFSSGMALITELSPARRRGLMISLAILFSPLGLGICSLLAGVLVPAFGWPALFFAGAAAGVPLLLFLMACLPESPGYLARVPEKRELRTRIMQRFGLHEDFASEPAEPAQAGGALATMRRILSTRLAPTLALWLLFFVMYVLGSVVMGWVPVALSEQGFEIAFASRSLFFWVMGSMVGTPLAGWCTGRIGIYRTGLAFLAGAILALALLTFIPLDPGNGALVMALLPLAGFSVAGVVTTLYTIAADAYPAAMRATGIGVSDAIGRVGGVIGAYAGVLALDFGGAAAFFGAILVMAVLSFVLMALIQFLQRQPSQAAGVGAPAHAME